VTSEQPFKTIFRELTDPALSREVAPRGERTREITDAVVPFLADQECWCTYPSRRLSLSYVCAEFLWYLRADPDDLSIVSRAKIWQGLAERGVIQSNYGVYLFRARQFQRCLRELTNDPYSRRASCVILQDRHYDTGSADIPCTYAVNFRIREEQLDMSVHMRSNDAWFGAGNDVPIFRWTQHMMAAALHLPVGTYGHHVDSLHLYERHWDAAERCLSEEPEPVVWPPMQRPLQMIEQMMENPDGAPVDEFHAWLLENARI